MVPIALDRLLEYGLDRDKVEPAEPSPFRTLPPGNERTEMSTHELSQHRTAKGGTATFTASGYPDVHILWSTVLSKIIISTATNITSAGRTTTTLFVRLWGIIRYDAPSR